MRIVHVENYYDPHLGYQIGYLAHHQRAKGHDVWIVTSTAKWPGGYGLDEAYQGIDVGRRESPGESLQPDGVHVVRLVALEWHSFCLLPRLGGVLRDLRPDVVHVHNVLYSPHVIIVNQLRRQRGYVLVYDWHAAPYNTNPTSSVLKRLWWKAFDRRALNSTKRQADVLSAVGYEERRMFASLLGMPEDQIRLVPLGTDLALFYPDPAGRREIREELRVDEDDVPVLTVGKVLPSRGYEDTLQAVAALTKAGAQVRYIVVGNGPPSYIAGLKDLARALGCSERVTWAGGVPRRTLRKWYSAADVGVWPGGPSVSTLEATACGLPLVVSSDAANREVPGGLVRWGNGVVFPRGDVAALITALRDLVTDREKRRQMADRALEARRDIGWEQHADRYLELYKQALRFRTRS